MNSPDARRQTPGPRRILVRGTNWLGDAVMTTPALLRLREKFPGAHIALLAPQKLAGLWQQHPALNEIISIGEGEGVLSVSKKLRRGMFDLSLVLPNSPRSALEVCLAVIPRRIGYARPWRKFFLTQAIPPRADAAKMRKRSKTEIKRLCDDEKNGRRPLASGNSAAHQIHEYLRLAAALGANPEPVAPQLAITPEEIEETKKKFGLENITRPVFGLNPGAEYGPAKRWPVEKFTASAKEIQRRTNCAWVLLGGESDKAIANQIHSSLIAGHPSLNLAGQTALRELMALLKVCRVLLTNDTGPMHVAAALGTPVVALFGSTSPELTGPGLPGDTRHRLLKSDAPCSPCFLRECPIDFRCMNGIGVARVVEAVLSCMNAGRPVEFKK